MICIQTDHDAARTQREALPRTGSANPKQRAALAMATPFPLLTAIASQLRGAGGFDESTSAIAARQLLEDAFHSVDREQAAVTRHASLAVAS